MIRYAVKVYRVAADLMSTTVYVEADSPEAAKAKAAEAYESSDEYIHWECEEPGWAEDSWQPDLFEAYEE